MSITQSLALDTEVPTHTAAIVVRLADEGIPVRAIARAVQHPSENVRNIIRDALESGKIIELPLDDWPKNSARHDRIPGTAPLSDEQVEAGCTRLFTVTPMEAQILTTLLRRVDTTKQQLHTAITSKRPDSDGPEIKIIDVVICKLRKKLKAFSITIETSWGRGYYISQADRDSTFKSIHDFYHPPLPEPNVAEVGHG